MISVVGSSNPIVCPVPITLVDGLPGAGKTALAVDALQSAVSSGRPCFAHRISGLSLSGVMELSRDDLHRWPDVCPSGSLVVVDECQDVFPQRKPGAPPEHIAQLAECRRRDVQFLLLTQDAKSVDHFVRARCGAVVSLKRTFGSHGKWSRSDGWGLHPDRSGQYDLPSGAFGLYESVDAGGEHRIKVRVPVKIYAGVAIVLAVVGLLAFVAPMLWDRVGGSVGSVDSVDLGSAVDLASGVVGTVGSSVVDRFAPSESGLPWDAPAYADVSVADPPAPACMISGDYPGGLWRCGCIAVQTGERLSIRPAVCADLAISGGFYPFDRSWSSAESGDASRGASSEARAGDRASHRVIGVGTASAAQLDFARPYVAPADVPAPVLDSSF